MAFKFNYVILLVGLFSHGLVSASDDIREVTKNTVIREDIIGMGECRFMTSVDEMTQQRTYVAYFEKEVCREYMKYTVDVIANGVWGNGLVEIPETVRNQSYFGQTEVAHEPIIWSYSRAQQALGKEGFESADIGLDLIKQRMLGLCEAKREQFKPLLEYSRQDICQ